MDDFATEYRDAVCTRVITMLSPANCAVATKLLESARPVAIDEHAPAAPPPHGARIVITRKVFPIEMCVAMLLAGALVTFVIKHLFDVDNNDDSEPDSFLAEYVGNNPGMAPYDDAECDGEDED